jgi:hypothetical protein
MSTPLPYALPVTSGWSLVDWLDHAYPSSPAAADGLATLTLPALDYNQRWQLTHALVSCTSTSSTRLRLYVDNVAVPFLRDGSDKGNFDVADWAMGLMIPPGRALIAQWTGCSVGAVGTLALQANIYRLAGT